MLGFVISGRKFSCLEIVVKITVEFVFFVPCSRSSFYLIALPTQTPRAQSVNDDDDDTFVKRCAANIKIKPGRINKVNVHKKMTVSVHSESKDKN